MNPVVKPTHAKVGEPVRGEESGLGFQGEFVKRFYVVDSPGSPVIGKPVALSLAPSAEKGAKFGGRGTDNAGTLRRDRATVNCTLHGGSDDLPRRRGNVSAFRAIVS